jgi:hypothetical protein
MGNAALYYPYINFRDRRWLNRAVLYWGSLWRMVPLGYESVDPPSFWPSQGNDLRQLEGEGILRSVSPEHVEQAVTALWTDLLAASGPALANRYAIKGQRRALASGGYPADPVGASEPGLADILTLKMNSNLFHELRRLDLAREGRQGWFTLDERLLDAYMTTIANELVEDRDLETVTDVPEHFRKFESNSLDSLQGALLPGSRAAATNTAEGADGLLMMTLAIDAVVPEGIDDMELSGVLQIRKDTDDLREAFQQSVVAMVGDLQKQRKGTPHGAEPSAGDLEKLRKKHIDKPLGELRKAMRSGTRDAMVSVINLRTGLEAGTLGAAIFAGLNPVAGVVAGLALGGYRIWRETSESRKKAKESPLAWLLAVEKSARRSAPGS